MKKATPMLQLSNEEQKLILFLELFGQRFKHISVYGLWVMKQFISQFGVAPVSLPLERLAKQIGVQHKKLREVLAELERVGLIEVSYPEQRERARVRQIKLAIQGLNTDFKNPNSLDEQLGAAYKKMQQSLALFQFVKILFIKTSEIKVTNKAEIAQKNNFFNFRSCLVLFALLRESDAFGFIFGCGIPEITLRTGLNKMAISRAIKQLKEIGMIRSHANGAIGNSFIQQEAPVYALNLSHAFWDSKAVYGNFYILKYPEPHVFEVQKIASLFNLFQKTCQEEKEIDRSKVINILKKKHSYLLNDPLCWMNPVYNRHTFLTVQKFEVAQLFQHYTALGELPTKEEVLNGFKMAEVNDVFCENNHGQERVQENKPGNQGDEARFTSHGWHDRFGLLQCVLEQWCARIYSQDRFLWNGLMARSRSEIREDHLRKLGIYDYLQPYELNVNAIKLKYNKEFQTENQKDQVTTTALSLQRHRNKWVMMVQGHVSLFLMKVMDLIAYNQISFLSEFLKYHLKVDGPPEVQVPVKPRQENLSFRIMPRSSGQTGSTCFFVMDRTATANQYFVGSLERSHSRFDFPVLGEILKLSPTLEQLKEFGLLPVSCMTETEVHAVPSEDHFNGEKLADRYSDFLSTLAPE